MPKKGFEPEEIIGIHRHADGPLDQGSF